MHYFDCEPDVSGQQCVKALVLSVRDVQGQLSLHWPSCCGVFFRPLEREAGIGLCTFKRGRSELEPRGCVCWTHCWSCLGIFSFFLFCFLLADFTVLCIIHKWRLEAGFIQNICNNRSVEEADSLTLNVGGRFANVDLNIYFLSLDRCCQDLTSV